MEVLSTRPTASRMGSVRSSASSSIADAWTNISGRKLRSTTLRAPFRVLIQ